MCGIAGWADWQRDLADRKPVITAMTRTLSPRGPDAQEVWVSPHVLLGHSRLAIIDIEGGRQPMRRSYQDGRAAVITFSGEIYNFAELRTELRSHGWSFDTRSDTEVLLIAYLHWGIGFTERLNGMYAFAIWDDREQGLLLVRDRLGIKPLYYAEIGTGVIFGSEPKALLSHPDMPAELDLEGIAELTVVPRAKTPGSAVYRGMREVRPGHMLVVDATGSREHRYWQLSAAPHREDFAATAGQVRDLLEDIVRRQVVADVPVGTLLSGGIDSSVITALATRQLDAGLSSHSVSVSTGSPGSDAWRPSADDPYAKMVAQHLGIKHFVSEITADDLLGGLDHGLRARDLPGWGDLDTSMYLLFGAVREHSTVALSGEASDEVFGGYAWQLDPAFVNHSSFPWMHGRRQPESLLRDDVRQAIDPRRYEADRYRQALAEASVLAEENSARRREREVFHLGLTRWLGALLDRKDRMSMAVGLEVRVPFADHRLAELLFNVPVHLKTFGGVEKALLRRASVDLLPGEVVDRPKSAYPASRDEGYLGTLRDLVRDLVSEPGAPVFDLLDRRKVSAALERDDMPGPITASTPAISLSYVLTMNRWLTGYGVRLVS